MKGRPTEERTGVCGSTQANGRTAKEESECLKGLPKCLRKAKTDASIVGKQIGRVQTDHTQGAGAKKKLFTYGGKNDDDNSLDSAFWLITGKV